MLLCGSHHSKVDVKSRLKIPAEFRRLLPESEDNLYYVTSEDGHFAQIYPFSVWERMAQKFSEPPRMDPSKLKLQRFTSYYGLLTKMDKQGRVLIPQRIREDAQIVGEVVIIGRTDHLEVWNNEIFRENLKAEPFTNADREKLAEQGI